MINTYDYPNFAGELFIEGQQYPNRTLQILGALGANSPIASLPTGFDIVRGWEYPDAQTYAIPDHKQIDSELEGADAPPDTNIARAAGSNVLQIWQKAFGVTYSAMGAYGQLDGAYLAGDSNPISNELAFQRAGVLEYIRRNLNWTIINGTYQRPVDNTAERQTRGLIQAAGNVNDNGGTAREITLELLDAWMLEMMEAGAASYGDSVNVAAGNVQLAKLNAAFRGIDVDRTRTVVGTRITTVLLTHGTLNFYHEPDMPNDSLLCYNAQNVSIVAMPIVQDGVNKGVLFEEMLAHTGARTRYQIYGELGVRNGPAHQISVLSDLSTAL